MLSIPYGFRDKQINYYSIIVLAAGKKESAFGFLGYSVKKKGIMWGKITLYIYI